MQKRNKRSKVQQSKRNGVRKVSEMKMFITRKYVMAKVQVTLLNETQRLLFTIVGLMMIGRTEKATSYQQLLALIME